MNTPTPAAIVLAIDDSPMNLELVVAVLEPEGYVVQTATTAQQGLELAAIARPAVVLMDLHFPTGMNGLEATRRLRADPRTAGVPVVALTAITGGHADEQLQGARFDAILTKPLDVLGLRETVRRLVAPTPA
jgi:two-component system cell cycle response regulator DivK